ncbi:hypothetical protein J4466_05720 [Candidatus Pacearchaeota archaeon]|nr:hypothetical protein [Candidatus Pacearchaeota archaeon]
MNSPLRKIKKRKINIQMRHIREITHEYETAFKGYIEGKSIFYIDRKENKAMERASEYEEYMRSLNNNTKDEY